MPHSQPIPDSTIGLLLLIGFVFFGWAMLNLIGNVERNVKRRMLQNFVYRLYQYQRWVTAVVRGLDEGVNAYYKVKDTVAISPVNERKFAPVNLMRTVEETPQQETPEIGPVPVSVSQRSQGWLKRLAS